MFQRLVRRLLRILVRGGYYLVYVLVASLFFAALDHYLSTRRFLSLAAVCLPTLAVLFGFSALLYNRARALPAGREQRRSLYAAERSLQATIVFMFSTAIGTVVATVVYFRDSAGGGAASPASDPTTLLWFFVPMMLVLFSFASFFMAIRAVSHRLFRWLSIREVLGRLR